MRLLRCGLLAVATACASAPPVAAPDAASGWEGVWTLTWTRPEGWRPPTFTGALTLDESDGVWSMMLAFRESGGQFDPLEVDVRNDAARLEFAVGTGDRFELDIFRDDNRVHGTAQWMVANGGADISWSPVAGQRSSDGKGPLVADPFASPWPVASPTEVGLNEQLVRSVLAEAENASYSGFVLVKNQRLIVASGSDLQRRVNIASVSKALSSLAVPFLLDEQKWPSVDAPIAPALDWAPDDPRAAISLRHVLSHTTGLETPAYRAWFELAYEDFRADLKSAKLLDPPGTKFAYSNRTAELTSEVVAYAAGVPLDAYLQPRLLDPLGIGAKWQHDPKGHAMVHAGVIANALDLAKIGVLLANDGVWENKRILPAGWVATAANTLATTASTEASLGWFLLEDGQGFQHTGDSGAFLLVLPSAELVAAGVHSERGHSLGRVMRQIPELLTPSP